MDKAMLTRCFGATYIGRERDANEDHFLIARLSRSLDVRLTSLGPERERDLFIPTTSISWWSSGSDHRPVLRVQMSKKRSGWQAFEDGGRRQTSVALRCDGPASFSHRRIRAGG